MANFNYGIDCPDAATAEDLRLHIENTNIYQDGLDAQDERVSVISKQGLLSELKKFAAAKSVSVTVEVWNEDQEYDAAEESGSLERHSF